MLPELSITTIRDFNWGSFWYHRLFMQNSVCWVAEDVRDTGWDGGASILRVSDVLIETLMKHYTFISRVGLISCSLLFEDSDSGLYSVTLFVKAVDDFKHKARENK